MIRTTRPMHIDHITETEAQAWLMLNDAEAAEFWQQPQDDFKGSVADNLFSFGHKNQMGHIQILLQRPEILAINERINKTG